MKIHATFANRNCDPELIELIDAWDEFCVDENYTGYVDSREKALKSWGDDLNRWVTLVIDVPDSAISAVFDPAVVKAEAVPEDESD